jgi:uncharacterized protein with HEPN domain
MARSTRVVLVEIQQAIKSARKAVAEVDLRTFAADEIRQAATERFIEIISEASRRLPDDLLARHVTIPWSDIKRIGNRIRHDYHRVSAKIIWDVVQYDLDSLEFVIEKELAGLTE